VVAIYEYRCERDGLFEQTLPLGTAPASAPCPTCSHQAIRVFSAPLLKSASRSAWTAAIDRADKSRFEPEVVTSLPPSGAPRRTIALTPKLRGLPRP
jgi:putative FmdB family regulatory protein